MKLFRIFNEKMTMVEPAFDIQPAFLGDRVLCYRIDRNAGKTERVSLERADTWCYEVFQFDHWDLVVSELNRNLCRIFVG